MVILFNLMEERSAERLTVERVQNVYSDPVSTEHSETGAKAETATEVLTATRRKSKPDFCVVGIGASAGGLDALGKFLSSMPPAPGFACVVVGQLSAQHENHLVEMLQPRTQMPVSQVLETIQLEPNNLYVISPDANLDSIDTHLRLSELEVRRTTRAPIDHFLRTLAVAHGATAIGVVLSGAGSDGALGMRQIKEFGGLTIAQDPQEAEYRAMPQSAIATGTVDLVMSVQDMAQEIVDYCATRPWEVPLGENDDLAGEDASLFEKILGEVRMRTGQEFATYKRVVILQRIRRRMRLVHLSTLQRYFDLVRSRAEEPRALCNDLLLSVTEFCRDADSKSPGSEAQSLRVELAMIEQQLAGVSAAALPATDNSRRPQPQHRELRAALDELESAREALQAINEKLVSLNEDNQYRTATLTRISEELQHLLASTGYATLLVDRALSVLRFTPLAAKALHLKDTDIGRPLADVRRARLYPDFIRDLENVVEHQIQLEQEFQVEDGSWFLMRAQPYRSALQGVEGAVVLLVDVTSRKGAELALRESDRRKEEFLAVLAHELRNPIAPIAAGIEVLQKFPEDAALVLRVAATMSRQTKQLVRLVDDLLEVGRIDKGKLMLRHQTVSIGDVVRDAVAALRPVLDPLEHRLTVELPDEPMLVHGDAARLTQVIGNLLHNAARYTAAHGQLKLRVARDGSQLRITMQDNGRGIAPEALQNVFEMFYQDRESGAVEAGLGVGLTLAKKLMELHGGTIIAESAGLGRGSTFIVQLPLASQQVLDSTAAVSPEEEITCDHRRVLIVDDNIDAAETMRLLMQSLGAGDVRTAASGPEAIEAGAQLRPDVVLLDLSMPGMDGYEVARRMRAEPWGKTALLIALTGWGQEQHRRRSHEAGFDRHLIKPADMQALRSALHD